MFVILFKGIVFIVVIAFLFIFAVAVILAAIGGAISGILDSVWPGRPKK